VSIFRGQHHPAVITIRSLAKDFKQKDLWKASLRACPKWMKYATYFFFVYAIINFILFMIIDIGSVNKNGRSDSTPSIVYRGFSGHWMAFYCTAMAVLYSKLHVEENDKTRRCPNGHPVLPS
jgi:hypothetical protein